MTPRPSARLVRRFALVATAVLGSIACSASPGETARPASPSDLAAQDDSCAVWSEFYGILGEDTNKIRREGDSVWVWAGGAETYPGPQNADWFDFTGAPIPPEELQYGLGKDAIPSIDDPVFTDPDDPDLLSYPVSPYRPCERPESVDEIMVIGHVVNGQARAYPTALLDHHELVNDEFDGTPFTIAWCPLADLAAVHDREYRGEVHEWGVSGYVYRNVFLVFDRATESLWYPFDDEGWTAVAGPRQGEELPYTLLEPMPLGQWRELHPDTEVLLSDRSGFRWAR